MKLFFKNIKKDWPAPFIVVVPLNIDFAVFLLLLRCWRKLWIFSHVEIFLGIFTPLLTLGRNVTHLWWIPRSLPPLRQQISFCCLEPLTENWLLIHLGAFYCLLLLFVNLFTSCKDKYKGSLVQRNLFPKIWLEKEGTQNCSANTSCNQLPLLTSPHWDPQELGTKTTCLNWGLPTSLKKMLWKVLYVLHVFFSFLVWVLEVLFFFCFYYFLSFYGLWIKIWIKRELRPHVGISFTCLPAMFCISVIIFFWHYFCTMITTIYVTRIILEVWYLLLSWPCLST